MARDVTVGVIGVGIIGGGIARALARAGWPLVVRDRARGFSEDQAIDQVYVKSGRFPEIGALGRPGRPEDQANAVAFLVSNEASFITGQAINVCGGQLMGI